MPAGWGSQASPGLRLRLGDEAFWPLLGEYAQAASSSVQAFVDLLRRRHPGAGTGAYLERWFR